MYGIEFDILELVLVIAAVFDINHGIILIPSTVYLLNEIMCSFKHVYLSVSHPKGKETN